MYSDSPHVIDIYNDSEEMKATFETKVNKDGWTEGYVILRCKMKSNKIVSQDSTGSIYVHITDGVQHQRLILSPEGVEKTVKGKK